MNGEELISSVPKGKEFTFIVVTQPRTLIPLIKGSRPFSFAFLFLPSTPFWVSSQTVFTSTLFYNSRPLLPYKNITKMELVRIPTTVSTKGKDVFSTLPDEMVIKVLKETLRASQADMYSAVYSLNLHEIQFSKLQRISKQIARLFPTAFYEACKFDFTPPTRAPINFRPLVLPPVIHRQFLRRLRMEFHVGDSFYVSNPFTGENQYFPLTHTSELFHYFEDARRLRDLTTKVLGFTKLAELEIHLSTKFQEPDNIERTLAIYEAAGITVYARKVTITAAPAARHLSPLPNAPRPTQRLLNLLMNGGNLSANGGMNLFVNGGMNLFVASNAQVTEKHWHNRLIAAITIKDIVAEPEN